MSVMFSVYGVPKPQGSVRAFRNIVVQGGSQEGREAQASWRTLVVDAARKATSRPLDGPIGLRLTFYLPRPKSAHKRLLFPAKKPDLDKLIRATGDALSTILYVDDAQIVYFEVRKVFATAERTPGLDLEAWLE